MTSTNSTTSPTNHPAWISNDLVTKASALQADLTGLSVLITSSSITFVHPLGDTYHNQLPTTGLATLLSTEPDISIADVLEPQLVPPASPQPPLATPSRGLGTPPLLTLPIPAPE